MINLFYYHYVYGLISVELGIRVKRLKRVAWLFEGEQAQPVRNSVLTVIASLSCCPLPQYKLHIVQKRARGSRPAAFNVLASLSRAIFIK